MTDAADDKAARSTNEASRPLRLAVVGLGRIGLFHAQHAVELARTSGACELVAVVDPRPAVAKAACALAQKHNRSVRTFRTITELLAQTEVDAAVIASPTALHREHARSLIEGGCRVMVEKPLTNSPQQDYAFARELDLSHPHALMLAFQRRFDAPLLYAKEIVDRGAIGRPFKYVSVLEDSRLMPQGYASPGLLADMSVHNIDEILWLCGDRPLSAHATGSRIYTHRISPVEEDFDDALLQLCFPERRIAQIQVSRNHSAGYRVETWVFGEGGVVHVGGFRQNPREVVVEAYGTRGKIDVSHFSLRDYGPDVPEFLERFGEAYAAELANFVMHCRQNTAFEVNHNDGVRAMRIIEAGIQSIAQARVVTIAPPKASHH